MAAKRTRSSNVQKKRGKVAARAAAAGPRAGKLKRSLAPMTAAVRRALAERGLTAAYRARPAYQRNDYLGWIAQAKRDDTKAKRVARMLNELARGGVYMNMKWTPATADRASAPRPGKARRAAGRGS